MDDINANRYKCYSCGKIFKYQSHFNRHKDKKTPCLIRDIIPEQLANPNRCIFCNKILSKKENLTRHLSTCKIKNGGMNILDEKVRYEQENRVLREQLKSQEINLRSETQILRGEVDAIKKHLASLTSTSNSTVNNTINNTINQQNNVTIHFYNYDNPKIDTLKLQLADLRTEDLNKKMVELIYFNKAIPENHVLYRPNLKEQRLLVYANSSWRNISGDGLAPVFINIKNTTCIVGRDKLNDGCIYESEDDFERLPPAIRKLIYDFNATQILSDGTIMEIITENREIVKLSLPTAM